jgi:hypothetical protein
MTPSGKSGRFLVGLLLMLAVSAGWAFGASAQDGAGSVTINAYACVGDDCTAPAVGVDFYGSILKLDYSAEGVTDEAGIVVLPLPSDLSPGYEFIITSLPAVNVPAGGDIPFAFDCTKNGGEAVETRYSQVQTDPGGDVYMAAISVAAGDEIACNWYLFSADTGAETPPVAELPNTGSGFEQSSLNRSFVLTFLALVGGLTAAYASIHSIRTRR